MSRNGHFLLKGLGIPKINFSIYNKPNSGIRITVVQRTPNPPA